VTELRKESERRIDLFEKQNLVNISSYNKKAKKKLPHIVMIVDEFVSLAEKQYRCILNSLKILAAQCRKSGIHIILCTQHPTVDVVPGSLKCNIPTRISLKVSTAQDSRVILDQASAEDLRGKGHGILKTDKCIEFQAMYLSETQAYKLVEPTFIEKGVKKHVAKRLPPVAPY
jgi:S-DNA-T family DNA segregation ATPase FtsK/SpoIIIE